MSHPIYPKAGNQARKVLDALLKADGEWVNGRFFLRELYLSQYHARIKELEDDYNWKIEHSTFKDEFRFLSYRILQETGTVPLLSLEPRPPQKITSSTPYDS